MTKEEARKIITERKDLAERVIRDSSSLRQPEILVAMDAKEMAEWLLQCLEDQAPWK